MSDTKKPATSQPGIIQRAVNEVKAGSDRIDAYGMAKGDVAREYYEQRWNDYKRSRAAKRGSKSR